MDEAGAAGGELRQGSLANLLIQGFDGVHHDGGTAAAVEQAVGRHLNAIFRDHSEDDEFRIGGKPIHSGTDVGIGKHVDILLFEQNLLALQQVTRQDKSVVVGNGVKIPGASLGKQIGAGRAAQAMRGELAELRVIGGVLAGAGNEESAPVASQINQPADVGQKALRSLDVESAAGKDEIALQINLPKNGLNRDGQGIAPPCLTQARL